MNPVKRISDNIDYPKTFCCIICNKIEYGGNRLKIYRDKYDKIIHNGDFLKFDNNMIFIFKMIGEVALLFPQERFLVLNANRICYDNKFYSATVNIY